MTAKQSNRPNTSNLSLPSLDTKDRAQHTDNSTVTMSTKESKYISFSL